MSLLPQRSSPSRRPFSSATADLRHSVPGRARHGTELLPDLLDFEGAVQLAHTLQSAPPASTTVAPPAAALERCRRELAAAEREARQPLRDAHTGDSLVPPERMARLLERAGAPAVRQRKAIASAARELFAPVEARTIQRIAAARRWVAEVRRDLGPVVAASGLAAARLEQLDAALTAATAVRSEALVARGVGAVGDAFAADVERAVLELPKGCLELPVAEWAGPRGFAAAHVARCEALCVAAFLHERARVDMLVTHTLHERLG